MGRLVQAKLEKRDSGMSGFIRAEKIVMGESAHQALYLRPGGPPHNAYGSHAFRWLTIQINAEQD